MSNGRITVHFDGINLDNCLRVGMKITGYARCPYCKQLFSYKLNLKKPENAGNGDNNDSLYEVLLDFAGNVDPASFAEMLALPPDAEDDLPCIPCRGCSRFCPRLQRQ